MILAWQCYKLNYKLYENYTIIWQENIGELEEQVRGSNENHTTLI